MIVRVLLIAVAAVVGVPLALTLYILLADKGVSRAGSRWREKLRPWVWLLPGLFLLVVFLIYPVVNTIGLSFKNADSSAFAGLKNYAYIFTDPSMLIVLRNNALWLVFFTLVTVTLGLLIAVLTNRVRYEAVAKAFIFLPMAISFVAAGVIWRFMYAFQPKGTAQIGTVNAALTGLIPSFQPGNPLGGPERHSEPAPRSGKDRRRTGGSDLLPRGAAADDAYGDGGDRHADHQRIEDLRHRLRHDQRRPRHGGHRQPHVQGNVQLQQLRHGQRSGRASAGGHCAGDAPEHPPLR
jgi:hypothetical protein